MHILEALFRRTRRGCIALLFAVALASIQPASAQTEKLTAAEGAIQQRIVASGADVAVYFKTLDGKTEWSLRPDDIFHAASTMKVPVMIELFHQVQQRKLKLDDKISIKDEFHSIVDGSPYTL